MFPHVFSPLKLRHKTLSSRITFGAHTANMSDGGLPSDQLIAYYQERVRGGAGMIVVEPVPVHQTAVLTRGNFRPSDDAVIPHFQRLVTACRKAGDPVMIQQLYHVGQHGDADNSFAPNVSPSGLPSYHDADGSHTMSEEDIHVLVDAFIAAALRAKRSGFDGVELFAAYHGVIDQFWTPWSNRRNDRWGGSFENRMRFSRTIMKGIREECGDDFIIGLAVSVDPESEATLALEDLQQIVAWHDERELMDYVTCGTGSYFDFSKLIPTTLYPPNLGVPFAAALKKVVTNALVQAESHIRTPEAAEAVIAKGQADMVSIVRGQIADPHLVAKAREGRQDDVRPCISCNQLCWGRRSRDYWISCLVNPSAGREFTWGGDGLEIAKRSKKVLVVGGGPAGLETARVAAERGHQVTLVEAADELGGQWRLAGRQPTRELILQHLDWYERELKRLDVEVWTTTEGDVDGIVSFGADKVVIATGARPSRSGFQRARPTVDRLDGAEQIIAIHDVLSGDAAPAGPVLLLDDVNDWRGIGTALFLQELGCEVTLVTAAEAAATALRHSAADVPARRRFARAGGHVIPDSVVDRWEKGRAWIRSTLNDETTTGEFAALVVAGTPDPVDDLSTDLDERGVDTAVIGDAVAARKASQAIYEARTLAMSI